MDYNSEIDQTLRDQVAQSVKQLRGDRTLKEFSMLVGLSLSYLSDIERGRTIPTIETLDQIAARGGATLKVEFIYEAVPPDYVMVKRSDLDELLKVADRFRYVYATMDYLMKPEYTPVSILSENKQD